MTCGPDAPVHRPISCCN